MEKNRHTHVQVAPNGGFTLIELMVAMVIGMVVIGAAASLFRTSISQKQSVTYTAQLQEESFFIAHVLRQQIAQIGYRPIIDANVYGRALPVEDRQQAFPADPDNWELGQTFKLVGNSLHYRYFGSSSEMGAADFSIYDCLGNPVPEGSVQENELALIEKQLTCTVDGNSEVIHGADEGVQIEQLIYIIGVDDDGDNVVDRSFDATDATNTDFINAQQIEVRLLFSTSDRVTTQSLPYHFNGEQFVPTDRKLRLESEIFMALRN